MRFHQLHGKNISLDEQRLVATRSHSFTHAMVFSERPLYPGELFLIEIEDITDRWTGHVKIGFAFHPPSEILDQCTEDAVYDHILHITVPNGPSTQYTCTCGLYRPLFNIGGADEYIHTPFASIRQQSIKPVHKLDSDATKTYPTSIGSRIGIVYAFQQKTMHMHCILNGSDYGPFAILNTDSSSSVNKEMLIPSIKRQRAFFESNKPVNEYTKVWAFVDVYGATKRVRIVQLYGPSTLRSLCRSTILSKLEFHDQINTLFLSNHLKLYLKFRIA